MEIEEFLPQYPSIDPDEIYRLYENETFANAIFRKKEFYEKKLTSQPETERPATGELLAHQDLMARFMGSHTLYNEILLFHFPGTGKTCTAIGVAETLFASKEPSITKALILVNNQELVRRFTNEIAFVCTKGQYLPAENEVDEENVLGESENERLYRRAKAKVRERYSIYTHQTFHDNVLRTSPPERWRNVYSNTIIVIDEVHNITNSVSYTLYHQFLHSLDNRKIMLLTGTPMRDDASEITPILNLILPMTMQLPLPNMFLREFVTRDGDNPPVLNEKGVESLTKACRGRTSYLRSSTTIPIQYIGKPIRPVRFFHLVGNKMSPFQTDVYDHVFQQDSGWYSEAQQASLFVFPDGSYGKNGFDTYIQTRSFGRVSYSADFLKPIASLASLEAKLEAVAKFSTKYASVIRSIVVDGPEENCFVYTESIREGGAIMFGLCLELFGFKGVTNANVRGNEPRYTILSSDEGSGNLKDLIRLFNRPENASGKKLRVLVGGRKIAEGLTFKNIQQIHIVTPHYNYAQIDQAIARGVRAFSHPQLPEGTPVKVFLHAALPESATPSIDVRMYHISENKDILIKQVERILKQSSFDCALSYDRNRICDGVDGSRACDYMACAYRCNGVPYPYILQPSDIDKSTSQLFYSDMLQVTTWFQRIFRSRFSVTMEELFTNPNGYTPMTILACADNLIQNNATFTNRYGFKSYLHQDGNIFFLADTAIQPKRLVDAFYTEYPVVQHERQSFTALLDQVSNSQDEKTTATLCNMNFNEQTKAIDAMHMDLQKRVVQQAIAAVEDTPMRQWILQRFASHITREPNNHIILSGFGAPLSYHRGKWTAYQSTVSQEQLERGIYGEMVNGKFRIVDLRDIPLSEREREALKRGKECKSFKKPDLVELILSLGIPLPENTVLPEVDVALLLSKYKGRPLPARELDYATAQFWITRKTPVLCETLKKWLL